MGIDIIGYRDTSMTEVLGYHIHVESHLSSGCGILVPQAVWSQVRYTDLFHHVLERLCDQVGVDGFSIWLAEYIT